MSRNGNVFMYKDVIITRNVCSLEKKIENLLVKR